MLALLLWIFAIYGGIELVIRIWRYRCSRSGITGGRMTLVLIVQNGEAYIEGALRNVGYKASLSKKDLRIVVVDAASTDATRAIVQRIQKEDLCVELLQLDSDPDANVLKQLLTETELRSPLYLIDLREWEDKRKIIPYLTRVVG